MIKAHPFRNHMTISVLDYIDGIEVFNGNPRHDSRNDIAMQWANRNRLLKTSGSDFHQIEDLARGALVTNQPIENGAQLIEAIRGSAGLYITF